MFGRLGRKLSQSRPARGLSLRSKSPGGRSTGPVRSEAVQEEDKVEVKVVGGGLKRLKALGRSKSEGRRRSWIEPRVERNERGSGEEGGEGGDYFRDTRLYWQDRRGDDCDSGSLLPSSPRSFTLYPLNDIAW